MKSVLTIVAICVCAGLAGCSYDPWRREMLTATGPYHISKFSDLTKYPEHSVNGVVFAFSSRATDETTESGTGPFTVWLRAFYDGAKEQPIVLRDIEITSSVEGAQYTLLTSGALPVEFRLSTREKAARPALDWPRVALLNFDKKLDPNVRKKESLEITCHLTVGDVDGVVTFRVKTHVEKGSFQLLQSV